MIVAHRATKHAISALLSVVLVGASTSTVLALPSVTMGEVNPGTAGSTAFWAAGVLGDQILFGADDGVHGHELWRTDLSSPSPTLVKDIFVGGSGDASYPSQFIAMGAYLYFTADDGTTGTELWRTDGTTAGTTLVKDIHPSGSSSPAGFTRVGDRLYFTAYESVHGTEVWVSDGTPSGTTLAADINTTAPDTGSDPTGLYAFNGSLWFRATNGIDGDELWRISGTTATSYDLHTGSLSSYPSAFTSFSDGYMYFQAYDQTNGQELWRTNGSTAPTLFWDISAGSLDSSPDEFAKLGERLYFAATTSAEGRELWYTDGTTVTLAADIWDGGASSNPTELTPLGTSLYYAAEDSSNAELRRFNGTSDVLVGEINLSGPSTPNSLTVVGNALYAQAYDGVTYGIARVLSGVDAISFSTVSGTAGFVGCMCYPILKVLQGRIYAPAYNDEVGMEYLYIDEPTYVLPETNRGNSPWASWLALAAAILAVAGVDQRWRESQRSR